MRSLALHVGALRRRSFTASEDNSIVFLERLPLAACWFCTTPTGSNDTPGRLIFIFGFIFSPRRKQHTLTDKIT